jgi:phosphoheptose isomerase
LAKQLQVEVAAILAGGKGERLRSAVADRPKALAPVANRPFLAHLLDRLSEAGIGKVVLCTGYQAEQVEVAFGSRYARLSLEYSRELEPLDTGGALRLALEHLDSNPVLVLNGDSFCELDLSALVEWHRWKRADATMALAYLSDVTRFGSVAWNENGRIVRFEEKGRRGSGWINAGIYLFSRSVLESMGAGEKMSLERDCFPALAEQGSLFAYPGGKKFIDIGTPESYAAAHGFFARAHSNHEGNGRAHVLVDRDGTLVMERGYLSDPAGLELLPGAVEAVARLQKMGLGVTVITNQSGVARGYLDRERVESIHERLRRLMDEGGATLDGIYYCPHEPRDNCSCRKPAPGMVYQAAADLCFDPQSSFLIGDKLCDIELGKVVGATTFVVRTGYGDQLPEKDKAGADYVVADLREAAKVIEKLLGRGSPAPGVVRSAGEAHNAMGAKEMARSYLLDTAETNRRTAENCAESASAAAGMIAECLRKGGKLLICGNGGSAAQCQHMAAELVSTLNKRVRRPGLAAIALTTDTSILTAIGNDFGFADVFARQVEALGRSGDVLLAISTSGTSENVVRAAEAARRNALKVVALVGPGEGVLVRAADLAIRAPSEDTQHIQEAHLAVEHLVCLLVEEDLFGGGKA